MNAVCTIAAKNYLAQARTLGDSLAKVCPELAFHILLADEIEGAIEPQKEKYQIWEAKDLGIPKFREMAFKYDVIEFSTSVKPFLIEHLFDKYRYEKIIYLDPDMYVYDCMDDLLALLNDDFVVLTPHILKPYTEFTGAISEEELLFVGIYNLGFAAFRDCSETRSVLSWWKLKLQDQCYGDKEDALHVDQRWMDFLPALYEKGVRILRHPGYNLAHWNMHERTFTDLGSSYRVDEAYPLVIFHFSGFDPYSYENICRKQTAFHLDNLPQYRRLFETYTAELLSNDYDKMSTYSNCYGRYENGISIIKYQRRLYRALLNNGYVCDDPFAVGPGTLYDLFEKNKLLINDKLGEYNKLRKTVKDYGRKIELMLKLMHFFKKLVGIKYYYLFMRFLSMYSRFEKQLFLVENQ